jgi:hypothetical protein
VALLGLALLAKSIGGLISLYTTGPQIELLAQLSTVNFDIPESGQFTISIKRHSFFDRIHANNDFQLVDQRTGGPIPVDNYRFLNSKRTDMSGTRTVPVAEFSIAQPGSLRLHNPVTSRFTEKDRLLVSPKVGIKGVFMILATVFTGILFIAGVVFFLLSLIVK